MNTKRNSVGRSFLIFGLFLLVGLFFNMQSIQGAGDTIDFVSGGSITVNEDGSFTTSGGDVGSGSIVSTTKIVSAGTLTVVLNNVAEVTITSIDVIGNIQVSGLGTMNITNAAGVGLATTGDAVIEAPLTVTGQDSASTIGGNLTVENTTFRSTAPRYGLMVTGNALVNNGSLYVGGSMRGIDADGTITVNGSSARIESIARGVYPVIAQSGITVDQGTIYVPDASVDGVSASGGVPPSATLLVTNNGLVEGYGDNSGVSGDYVVVDNARIVGTSNRIGSSAEYSMIARNGGIIDGSIIDGSGLQDYGIAVWEAGTLKAETNGQITGTGEIGVLGYNSGTIIEASDSLIHGIGLQYGVESMGPVKANAEGKILGESINQVLTARGVGSRTSMVVDDGTVIGHAYYTGVASLGPLDVQNNSVVEGYATLRADGTAAVKGTVITVDNNGRVLENYAGALVPIDDITPINPYFASINMIDLHNYEWSTSAGKLKVVTDGVLAKKSAPNAIVEALRTGNDLGVTEVVQLGLSGINEHVIQLPASLTATPVYYTLSFDLNGGTGASIPSQSLEEDDLATPVDNPLRDNHIFTGWNTAKDGSGTEWTFTTSMMPANDVVLYAQWLENKKDAPISPDNRAGAEAETEDTNVIVNNDKVELPKTGGSSLLMIAVMLIGTGLVFSIRTFRGNR